MTFDLTSTLSFLWTIRTFWSLSFYVLIGSVHSLYQDTKTFCALCTINEELLSAFTSRYLYGYNRGGMSNDVQTLSMKLLQSSKSHAAI